jgi:hypothetical protein
MTSHRDSTTSPPAPVWERYPVLFVALLACVWGSACGSDGEGGTEPRDEVIEFTPIHDPLSMPEEPTLNPADFNSATTCRPCHPQQYAEWRVAQHSHATIDPAWRVLVGLRQAHFNGQQDQFCTQCHSAICTRGGECVEGFSFDDLSPISLEGVTCEACHKVKALARPYNSGHVLDPSGPMIGTLADPQDTPAHESEFKPLIGESRFCGGCHDVIENSGLDLERPYREWQQSPAAAAGMQCQDCHMPTYTGRAAVGGPVREGLHSHRFPGVATPIMEGPDFDPAVRDQMHRDIDALFAGVVTLGFEVPPTVSPGSQLDLLVSITNNNSAHNLPTGTTFVAQLWAEITATDATGAVLYRTGHLDENGDLGNAYGAVPYSDPDLITLGTQFVDRWGNPTLFPWLASEHNASGSLPALHTRTWTLFVPVPAGAPGPISIAGRLRYRIFAPFLLRALGAGALVEHVELRDIASAEAQVNVE